MKIPGPCHQRLWLSGPGTGPTNLHLKGISTPRILKVARLETKDICINFSLYQNKSDSGDINSFTSSFNSKMCLFFFKDLFILERHRDRGRDIGKGRSRLPVGNGMRDLIPGPQDHALSQRQTLNYWVTQVALPDVLYWLIESFTNSTNIFWRSYKIYLLGET